MTCTPQPATDTPQPADTSTPPGAVTEPPLPVALTVSPTPTAPAGPTGAPIEVVSDTIGLSGALLTASSGESVDFPGGCLPYYTAVSLSVFDASAMPRSPAGLVLIGHGVDVQPRRICDAGATLTLPYLPDNLRQHDTAHFGIWTYDAGVWHFLGGVAHADQRNVTLDIREGGVYGLMVAPFGLPPASDYLAPETGTGDAGRRGAYLPLALGIMMLASLGGTIVLLGSRRRC